MIVSVIDSKNHGITERFENQETVANTGDNEHGFDGETLQFVGTALHTDE